MCVAGCLSDALAIPNLTQRSGNISIKHCSPVSCIHRRIHVIVSDIPAELVIGVEGGRYCSFFYNSSNLKTIV